MGWSEDFTNPLCPKAVAKLASDRSTASRVGRRKRDNLMFGQVVFHTGFASLPVWVAHGLVQVAERYSVGARYRDGGRSGRRGPARRLFLKELTISDSATSRWVRPPARWILPASSEAIVSE